MSKKTTLIITWILIVMTVLTGAVLGITLIGEAINSGKEAANEAVKAAALLL